MKVCRRVFGRRSMYVQRFEEELDDGGGVTEADGMEGWTIHHIAETSRHIAGSDVMPEISTNNLYADVSARSRFAGLLIRGNKLTPLCICGRRARMYKYMHIAL